MGSLKCKTEKKFEIIQSNTCAGVFKMTNMSENTPWQNGYWSMKKQSTLFMVEGEKWVAKSLIALDYPDVESSMPLSLMKYGDFGATPKEMAEAIGEGKFNIKIIWYGVSKMQGFVDDSGTKIHFWNDKAKAIEVITWLTPENIAKLKEDRDDMNTPR